MKNKTAIMLASYGSVSAEARSASLDAVKSDMEAAFPTYGIFSVCTSDTVRRKIKALYGTDINSPEEAMESIAAAGYKNIVCQTTFIMNGTEYDGLCKSIRKFRKRFDNILIASPLITPGNAAAFIETLNGIFAFSDDKGYVFVGHGTKYGTDSLYGQLQKATEEQNRRNVFFGALENRPDADDVTEMMKKAGYKKAVLIPLLVTSGLHASRDIFGESGSWYAKLKEDGFETEKTEKGLAEYEKIRGLWVNSAACLIRSLQADKS